MARFSASDAAGKKILHPVNLIILVAIEALCFYCFSWEEAKESAKVCFFIILMVLEYLCYYWYFCFNDPTFRDLLPHSRRGR